jgi:hypothetical protein
MFFGRNVLLHVFWQLGAAVAVVQGDSHGLLGFILPDDVLVQQVNDLLWSLLLSSLFCLDFVSNNLVVGENIDPRGYVHGFLGDLTPRSCLRCAGVMAIAAAWA